MLTLTNLIDNSEKKIDVNQLKEIDLSNIWIDAFDPNEEEYRGILEKLDLSMTLLKPSELSVLSSFYVVDEKAILYFASINNEYDPQTVTPVTIIFSKGFMITVRMREVPAVDRAKHRLHKTKADSPSYVAYAILDEMVTEYYNYLELVEDQTASLEENILENPSENTLKDIFRLKSKMISFNKLLWYERGVLFSLKKAELSFLTTRMRNLFDDLHDDLARQVDIIETFREILSDGFDAYLSVASNKINLSIKRLTVIVLYLTIISVLTAFPNTVATFFGIPVFGTSTDWRIIILLIALSTLIPLIWLLGKKWTRFE